MRVAGCNGEGEPYSEYVEHDPVDLDCSGDLGLTRQEFRDECDINVLMAGYERTGVISHVNQRQPMYLDVSAVPDLQSAIEQVKTATDAFMSLPASVRRDFDNDPVAFVNFAQDPSNIDKLREWGLAKKLEGEPVAVAPTVSGESPGTSSS